jgi:Acyltransferase
VWFIGIKLRKLPDSVPVLKGKSVMLIGNHRNFCDFVLHDVITEHTANFLSRALVGLVFPFMALVSIATDGVWYFVRGGNKDFDKFFQWIDSKFQRHLTGRTHLLVYPEGHRNLKKEPLCLRSGMIRYAFSRQIPIQMFMCSGYDEVLNEKKISAAWGTSNVNYKVYEPIFTGQYLNFDSLIQELKDKFNTRFHEVHNPS